MKLKSLLEIIAATAALVLVPCSFAQRTPPKPLTTPSPKYPTEMVDTGLSGTATIDVIVKADGSVADPVLNSADTPSFGEAAMAVIKDWKFTPATQDGTPVDLRVSIPFKFSAPFDQKINAMAKRKVYLVLPEPALTAKEYGGKLKVKLNPRPNYPKALYKSGFKQDIKVTFVVAPDGKVVNPRFEGEPRVELIIPALAAITQMTYEPPLKKNIGVFVEASTTLHFEEPPAAERGGGRGKGGDGGGGGDPGAGPG